MTMPFYHSRQQGRSFQVHYNSTCGDLLYLPDNFNEMIVYQYLPTLMHVDAIKNPIGTQQVKRIFYGM